MISDEKFGVTSSGNSSLIDHYEPDIVSATDYYPFGMVSRVSLGSAKAYRFEFNGKENDNEVKGYGGQQDYGMRIYDSRVGRFLSIDPLTRQYPELTPLQFACNTPLHAIDLDGAEPLYVIDSKNYEVHDYSKKENREALKRALLTYATASDVNDATVIVTSFTRKQAINVDGTGATGWDKGFAYAGAVLPFVSGSLVKAGLKDLGRSSKWTYHAIRYGSKVADAISGGGAALRRSLEKVGIKMAGLDLHHIIPTQLLTENKVVQSAVNSGFDFNGAKNGIALTKVADGGVHANHPNYTSQITSLLDRFAATNKNYTGDEAKEFLVDLTKDIRALIEKESVKKRPESKYNRF